MIGRLRGIVVYKQPPSLLLEVGGVGYELEASLTTFQHLPANGQEATLLTHLVVREDAHTLYAFAQAAERDLFRNLIRVTGIGSRLALLILSGMSVELFSHCIRAGDTTALTKLPGIGKKTAERLLLEMRDRIGALELPANMGRDSVGHSNADHPSADAVSALVALGYKLPEATRMVQSVQAPGLSSEELIRQALQNAVRR